ncbi:MAG: MFS transporter [Patescibacteria group bacterium]|nr:MFS transporter [Patescibacteria group bacterium]
MSIFPKIERITFNASISHFFLMFGYKLFSLYFPLFLIAKGMSLPQVAYAYVLIYLPIAIFSPITGYLNHKINSWILIILGILGYAIYCLGMILIESFALFYLFQILLGISATLFFVSMRKILMAYKMENHNRAFAWFYSSPYYASAIAPIVGAILIYKFNFIAVFVVSLFLHFLNIIFCLVQFKNHTIKDVVSLQNKKTICFAKVCENYQNVFKKLKQKIILIPILICFSVLILSGFYRAFFVLFLKDLGWSQDLILFFVSLISFIFLPISFFTIKRIGKKDSENNIYQGSILTGILSIVLGGLGAFASFYSIFLVKFGQAISGLMFGSGRSGMLAKKLKEYPEEASAIDTIFSPLGVAIGSLFSGLIITFLGFNNLFIFGGIFVIVVVLAGKRLLTQK